MSDLPMISTISGRHHPDHPRLTVFVSFPFDEVFIGIVKREIPKRDRAFAHAEKIAGGRPKGWWVSPEWRTKMMDLLRQRFCAFRVEAEDGSYEIDEHGESHEELQARLL